jgi:hypothetical protein
MADSWRREGCDREQRDRRSNRNRRRLARRLPALAAEGVTVNRVSSRERMNLDESIIEVIEYGDVREFGVRICAPADQTSCYAHSTSPRTSSTNRDNWAPGPTTEADLGVAGGS